MSEAPRHDDRQHAADVVAAATEKSRELTHWLLGAAFPFWWSQGADRVNGGFHEQLRLNGDATSEPRRARLHPRQMYSFRVARDLGWNGPVKEAVRHALRYFLLHYLRPDGLYRGLVDVKGHPLDDTATLYDQAFALLGFAAAFDVLDEESTRDHGLSLLAAMYKHLRRSGGGFDEHASRTAHLSSNSHMHLLEAALAWMELDHDHEWRELAAEIVQLALHRFRHAGQGPIHEFFAGDWTIAPSIPGSMVEPGHQFEWAGLLMRWGTYAGDDNAISVATSLIDATAQDGVDPDRNVVMNALSTDGSVRDSKARLWPQTERLKAACIAAATTGSSRHWNSALEAATVVSRYLHTRVRGLWYDVMTPDGAFVEQPAPASSLYHLAGAIAELDYTLNRTAR